MSELRDLMERTARQVEDPDAFDQLRHRRSVRERRRRVGTAALALVIAGAGIGVAAVALRHQGGPVTPGHTPSPTPIHSPSPTASPGQPALCSSAGMKVSVQSGGAAGTMKSVWRAQNVSGSPCRSFGYPGMAIHGPSGWVNLQLHHGGFADINGTPQHILVRPGKSLYFVTYWSDVTTTTGGCTQFDHVRVTLPDNRVPNVVTTSGCLNPDSVDIGPVTTTAPSP